MQQDDLEGLIELIQGFVVLTFLAWLGFGVATAIVAVRRGHSGLGGFGLGILLGPFGLVIELLRIPDRVALAPKGITRGEKIIRQLDEKFRDENILRLVDERVTFSALFRSLFKRGSKS